MKNIKIEWSKGFFRIWVITTVVWLMITLPHSTKSVFEAYELLNSPLPAKSAPTQQGSWKDAPIVKNDNAQGNWRQRAIPVTPETLQTQQPNIQEEIPPVPEGFVPLEEMNKKEREKTFYNVLMTSFENTFLLPLFFLVVWFCGHWVLKGFIKKV